MFPSTKVFFKGSLFSAITSCREEVKSSILFTVITSSCFISLATLPISVTVPSAFCTNFRELCIKPSGELSNLTVSFNSSKPADALLINSIIPSGEVPCCNFFIFRGFFPSPGIMFNAFPPIKELSETRNRVPSVKIISLLILAVVITLSLLAVMLFTLPTSIPRYITLSPTSKPITFGKAIFSS
ncbi:MAG: hypothetical protein BWX46_00388 [Candidatus Cloacimonetes bacterium ADurb.Bin003]|nr:MAG: hypothetical protein BWX46_00388 [Candidatus Cloacimonetes bacterium ADurb.Bin003]